MFYSHKFLLGIWPFIYIWVILKGKFPISPFDFISCSRWGNPKNFIWGFSCTRSYNLNSLVPSEIFATGHRRTQHREIELIASTEASKNGQRSGRGKLGLDLEVRERDN
uniref:Uncharacterized protein n=1 Tax=Opuntia streptacantha TaxID=393608 RepID=A0A7C8YXU2_OPUST